MSKLKFLGLITGCVTTFWFVIYLLTETLGKHDFPTKLLWIMPLYTMSLLSFILYIVHPRVEKYFK